MVVNGAFYDQIFFQRFFDPTCFRVEAPVARYTRFEVSKDGTAWEILNEKSTPPDDVRVIDTSYIGDIPFQLLGGNKLYFKVTFYNIMPDGTELSGPGVQLLHYTIADNNNTFKMEVDFGTPEASVVGLAPILLLLINDKNSNRTELLDPTEIGGPGTSIIYQGNTYPGPVYVAPGSIVGIKKNGEYYLYHPSMGTGITFSEVPNKRAALYS